MTRDIAHEIRPYLNPLYWDGHSIGHGEVTPIIFPRGTQKALDAAKLTVARYVSRGRHILEGISVRSGDTFDAKDHPPGTVVVWQTELITSDIEYLLPGDGTVPLELVEGLQLPEKPLLHQTKKIQSGVITTELGGSPSELSTDYEYETFPSMGAVALTGVKKRPVLYGIESSEVSRSERGAAFTPYSFDIPAQPITVDQVLHPYSHMVARVTELQFFPPPTKKNRRFIPPGALGRLIPNT